MKRLPMMRIREVLRLSALGLSGRQIASGLGLGRGTVQDYLARFREAGLVWPLPEGMSDAELGRVFHAERLGRASRRGVEPDWAMVHRELRRQGVTLRLLWEEYRADIPEGYGYSRFCELYGIWKGRVSPVMRQVHPAGERLFVDYAGQTVGVTDPGTGEVRQAQLFVAALGASHYTYAEATWSQGLPDWLGSHVRAFAFFGGVPAQVVPDNLKSGVNRACLYDPEMNRAYAELAAHYGTAVVPTRPRRPRDKAKVEVAVQLAERWILAVLRNRVFFSLDELNGAIRPLLERLNAKESRHLGASRVELYGQLDRPALRCLPSEPYEFAEWKRCRAGLDYHVALNGHYYSVPHQLVRKALWARLTERLVEVYHDRSRVASHLRADGRRGHTTQREHMPAHHRFREDWTPERMRARAAEVGPNVAAFADAVMGRRQHPEQGYRTCIGVIRLADSFGAGRVDAACQRAIGINGLSYTSVQSILKNGIDRRPRDRAAEGPAITHPNIRGADYFN